MARAPMPDPTKPDEPQGAAVIHVRSADRSDAALVHALYRATPAYFDIISIPVPTLAEVSTELAAAERDPRRSTELVIDRLFDVRRGAGDEAADAGNVPPRDPRTGGRVVGYLDYTLNYPERGDATVNLLLVHGGLQSRGYGRKVVTDLERRLRGRAVRLLASIYGRNPRAERFWKVGDVLRARQVDGQRAEKDHRDQRNHERRHAESRHADAV